MLEGYFKLSIKAFTFNLVSDIFLIASFIFFYFSNNNTKYYFVKVIFVIFRKDPYLAHGVYMLVISAGIKSVQIWAPLVTRFGEAPVPAF